MKTCRGIKRTSLEENNHNQNGMTIRNRNVKNSILHKGGLVFRSLSLAKPSKIVQLVIMVCAMLEKSEINITEKRFFYGTESKQQRSRAKKPPGTRDANGYSFLLSERWLHHLYLRPTPTKQSASSSSTISHWIQCLH